MISDEIGSKLDIAFLKLCYVDVTAGSDVRSIFRSYQAAMEKINQTCPTLQIIHWTLPLTVSRTTWKTKIKKILGKTLWECEDNRKRWQFNSLVRNEYKGKEPVFDLARIESGAVERQPTSFRLHGESIETLNPRYTNDGGHLNAFGRKVVAGQLLLFLASMKV